MAQLRNTKSDVMRAETKMSYTLWDERLKINGSLNIQDLISHVRDFVFFSPRRTINVTEGE